MTLYDDWPSDRAFTLMSGLWTYMEALEHSDERVVRAATKDLLELKARIDRLVAKTESKAA